MAKTIRKHKKTKWSIDEVARLYNLAINEHKSMSYLIANSIKQRTPSSIRTKLWKSYGINTRKDKDGEIYFYLKKDVPKRIVRKRKVIEKAICGSTEPLGTLATIKLPTIEERLSDVYDEIGKVTMRLEELKTLGTYYKRKLLEKSVL